MGREGLLKEGKARVPSRELPGLVVVLYCCVVWSLYSVLVGWMRA